MPYRLLCLDAGFTLLQPRRNLAEALTAMLEEHGHPAPTDEALRAAWEVADRWFWDGYHRDDNETWRSDERIEALWREYHRLMLGSLGVVDEDGSLIETILASQFSPDSWTLYPDVAPALAQLAGPSLAIGIVSDWGSNLGEIVRALGLDRWVDFVLASGAEGLAKPDPAFFSVALARAGVQPHEAIMVGDSFRADVLGARAAGMNGVLLDRGDLHGDRASGRGSDGADGPVIRSLLELPALLAGAPIAPS
jgi:putative hydrolase of the HAD superfamily